MVRDCLGRHSTALMASLSSEPLLKPESSHYATSSSHPLHSFAPFKMVFGHLARTISECTMCQGSPMKLEEKKGCNNSQSMFFDLNNMKIRKEMGVCKIIL